MNRTSRRHRPTQRAVATTGRKVGISALALIALASCSSSAGGGSAGGGGGGGEYVTRSQDLLDTAADGALTGPSAGAVPEDQVVAWSADDMPAPSALPADPVRVGVVAVAPFGPAPYAIDMIEAVGADLGWEVTPFMAATNDQQGGLAAMRQAILDGSDAIISIAVPALWVSPALDEARAQDIPTVAVHGNEEFGPGFAGYVTAAEGLQKALLGAWIVAHSDGGASTLLVAAPGFEDAEVPVAQAYLDECAGCTSDTVEISPDIIVDPTRMQATMASTLAGRPDTDYVLWPNGNAPLQGVLNGIRASRAADAQVVITAAGPQSMQLLQDGTVPVVVQVPEALLNLAAMDQVSRLLQGEEPIANDALRLPVGIWGQGDAPSEPTYQAITAAQLEDNDWLSPYEDAWGVQLEDTILGVSG